jgi:GDP-L-fucose synthase
MNIIFGGNGFIGKNIELQGERPSRKECDLESLDSVTSYLSSFKNNNNLKIINLAAYVAGFTFNATHNVEMLYKNSLIALNVMYAIKKLDINPYYLYVSSVCGYKDGNSTEDLFFNDRPGDFNYGYGSSKRLGVSCIDSLILDMKIKSGVLIPTNMYGEYDNFNPETSHVIPNLIRKISKHTDQLEILGNVNNRRDFLYAKDFGRILNFFIEKEQQGIYNVSTGSSISILDLANELKDIFDFKGTFHYSEPSEKQIQLRKTNNSKLMTLFDNFKFTPIRQGLINTIKYYDSIK